jgi:hypothetical protein
MKDFSTQEWRNAIDLQSGIQDIKSLLHELSKHQYSWASFLRAEKESRGMKTAALAARCGVTRQAVEKWLNKDVLPVMREGFVSVGMALGMNIEEINHLLQRYGKCPSLYAKNIDDAISIFVINRYCKLPGHGLEHIGCVYHQVQDLKDELLSHMDAWEKDGMPEDNYATKVIQDAIYTAESIDQFLEYVRENKVVFLSKPNIRLQRHISRFIRMQVVDSTDLSITPSIHMLVQNGMLNKGFERMYSLLCAQGEIPGREKIIALGMSFNMTTEMIDKLLEYARMEPLCAKDRIELVLLYAIRKVHLLDPTMEYDIALKLSQVSDDIEIKARNSAIVKKHQQMDPTELESETDFLCVNDYVKYVFEYLDMEEEAHAILSLLDIGENG